ncbi:MAG: hypothetical protein GY820_30295 [Gammaproteobacteria bacterium]|nr:hypothetical protein [Gammaproteobacteria bacterium]
MPPPLPYRPPAPHTKPLPTNRRPPPQADTRSPPPGARQGCSKSTG